MQIVTCNPDIKTVADLKGKTVSVGVQGSGVYFNALDVLTAYGMTLNDIDPKYQNFGDSTESLKDNKIDAAFVVAGAPTNSIVDLSTAKKAYIVTIVVYSIVKTIFEGKDKIQHGKAADLDLGFATSVTAVPFHKGAAKYYAEKNITVKTR